MGMLKAILGRKVGMTSVYNPLGESIPVTVVEAGPCPIVQVKTLEKDGYAAIQLGLGQAKLKNVEKSVAGHFAKVKIPPTLWLREIRLKKIDGVTDGFTDGVKEGQEIRVGHFAAGDVVDVSGINKGKGFAGAVKRHRFRGGPKTHGQSDRWRAPGSSGRERVWPGKRGPGHMGTVLSTVQRLKVVSVDSDKNLLLIQGSVPGAPGGYVTIRQTTRPKRAVKKAAVPIKSAAKAAAKK